MTDPQSGILQWIDFFETIAPDNLDRLDVLTTEDIRFRDPFNDVTGRKAVKAVFADMFAKTEGSRFAVLGHALDGRIGYLRWDYRFRPKDSTRDWLVDGMSEIHMTESGLVAAHFDHWDSGRQFYARLPVIGWVVERIRRRLDVTAHGV